MRLPKATEKGLEVSVLLEYILPTVGTRHHTIYRPSIFDAWFMCHAGIIVLLAPAAQSLHVRMCGPTPFPHTLPTSLHARTDHAILPLEFYCANGVGAACSAKLRGSRRVVSRMCTQRGKGNGA